MPRANRQMTKVNFYVQKPVMEGLRKVAQMKGTCVSEIVRNALKDRLLEEVRTLQEDQEAMYALTGDPADEKTE